ncbi:helix-turn-helix transcriptional regulator [Schaalia sp. Marseille-Q2122]|uniref:helix-turn-helix domain-containing protein n=1 Tax=Schaalia sp. Marseille-Q2122 TaxID=2736604 RepID=UPI00158D6EF9|nr:helix-turn-helix transcriptional regulator [Schaalia sp. Marseille-Q2122]
MDSTLNAISTALHTSGISQRQLAEKTGISQPTISRIMSGERPLKMPELILIADAIGCSTTQLTGSAVAQRVRCAARSTNGSNVDALKSRLLHFMEIDAMLDELGVPEGQ